MYNLSDDDRFSTQLEGKKLKGFGAKIGEMFGHIIDSTFGRGEGIELDNERGVLSEEIIFDDIGQQEEERKKKQAMLAAQRAEKARMTRTTTYSRNRQQREKEHDRSEKRELKKEEVVTRDDPKKEIEQIRETSTIKKEALAEPNKQQGQQQQGQQALKEGQKILETSLVKQEALQAQSHQVGNGIVDVVATAALLGVDNMKHMDHSQTHKQQQQKEAEFSPAKAAGDLVKLLASALLPTQVPDVRGQQPGQEQGAQQQQGGGHSHGGGGGHGR